MLQVLSKAKETANKSNSKDSDEEEDEIDPLIAELEKTVPEPPRRTILRIKRKRNAAQAEIFAVSDRKRLKLDQLFSKFTLDKSTKPSEQTKLFRLVKDERKNRDFRGMQSFFDGSDRMNERIAKREAARTKRMDNLRKALFEKNETVDSQDLDDDVDVIDVVVKGDEVVLADEMEDEDEEDYRIDYYYEDVGWQQPAFDVSCPVFYLVDPSTQGGWDVDYDYADNSFDSQDSNHEDYYANDYPDEDYFDHGCELNGYEEEEYNYEIEEIEDEDYSTRIRVLCSTKAISQIVVND